MSDWCRVDGEGPWDGSCCESEQHHRAASRISELEERLGELEEQVDDARENAGAFAAGLDEMQEVLKRIAERPCRCAQGSDRCEPCLARDALAD